MTTIATSTDIPQTLSLDARAEIIAGTVANFNRQGWRVMSQTQTNAQLVKGKKTSHGLHIFLSIITLGLWIPVWILIAVTTGEKAKFVAVDELGKVTIS